MHLVPDINQPITLSDAHDRVYPSRVEDTAPGALVVAQPLQLRADHALERGAEVLIAWTTARGVAVLPGQLVDMRRERTLRLWVIELTGEAWCEQRREFVRVPALGSVVLQMSDAERDSEPAVGQLVDVSEAALCCAVDDRSTDGRLVEGVELTSRFHLGRQFDLPGRLTHVRPARRSPAYTELVVLFDTTAGQADALRREVFAHQLRLRRTAPG